MDDIYFYGKLNAQRDFVKSLNISNDEIEFWSNWLNKCNISKQMPNFIKISHNKKIWAFVIKSDHIYRSGIITMSCDFSGRKYPFIVYDIFDYKSILNIKESYRNGKLSKMISFLKLATNQGQISSNLSDFCHNPICYSAIENIDFHVNNLFNIKHNQISHSNWLEMSNLVMLSIDNPLTCSFYNRIFG